jgi:integrase
VKGYKRCKCRDESGRELGSGCPSLRRADGSWNPSHGKWYAKHELPPAPDGSRVFLRQGGFATRGEMSEWFEETLRLLSIPERGPGGHEARAEILDIIKESRKRKTGLPDYDDMRRRYQVGAAFRPGTTGEFLLSWLEARRAAGKIKRNTLRGYESHIRRVFLPAIGAISLDKLRPSHVMKCLTTQVPGTQGPATRQRMRATLRKALTDAKRAGLIDRNPAASDAFELASGGRPKLRVWTAAREQAWREDHERRIAEAGNPGRRRQFAIWLCAAHRPAPAMVWKPAHTGAFLDAAAEDRLYPLFHLITFRGMRRGEACALKWPDVDLDSGLLMVGDNRVQLGWEVEESTPKSESSDAAVSLDSGTVAVLRAWRKLQLEERLAWGPAWSDTGHVFTHEDGAPLHPAQVTARFRWIAFDAGLPPIRLHDLRHGAATIAHAAGADLKAIQAMLRHSSITITADIYTSVLDDVDRDVAERMIAMVPRKAASEDASAPGGLPSVSRSRAKRGTRREPRSSAQANQGGAPGARTLNQRIKSPLLYR